MKHSDGTECNFILYYGKVAKCKKKVYGIHCDISFENYNCDGKQCIHQQILSRLKQLNGETP